MDLNDSIKKDFTVLNESERVLRKYTTCWKAVFACLLYLTPIALIGWLICVWDH